MIVAVADTHAVIWYLLNDFRLSSRARDLFEDTLDTVDDQIGIASITLVEMTYLVEKSRIPREAIQLLEEALDEEFSLFIEIPLFRRFSSMLRHINPAIVRDMPDRVIAASAYALGVPLITKDAALRKALIHTIW